MRKTTYTESELNSNLSELAHEFLRELYLAGKKVSIYSAKHPMAVKALARPFMLMDKILNFKEYLNLHVEAGHLYALNIRVKPCMFTDQVMDYMLINDLTDILFHNFVTVEHLSIFLERFVKKLPTSDYKNLMSSHLEKNNVQSITVNSRSGHDLFESGVKYRSDVLQDFSVKAIVGMQIGTDFSRMAEVLNDTDLPREEYIEKYHHDYNPQLVNLLIPEAIGRIDASKLIKYLSDKIHAYRDKPEAFGSLINVVKYHHQSDFILNSLDELAINGQLDRSAFSKTMPETSRMKLEVSDKIDSYMKNIFSSKAKPGTECEFSECYGHLLRRGQVAKAQSVISGLLKKLAGDNLDYRRQALVLLKQSVEYHDSSGQTQLQEFLVEQINDYMAYNDETFEFSDLIWALFKNLLKCRNYALLDCLCSVLIKKREQVNGVWTYESVAVKKSVEEINRPEIINHCIQELQTISARDFGYLKTIIITIGSEEMAFALSEIISHESRQIRQMVLKIMPELGQASLDVFGRFMNDEFNFERDDERRELPDEKWYRVRNAIFVLGMLKKPAACRHLRLHISDSDIRIRREIVSALEKIGGEDAIDLLLLMANDPDREIREAAIISIGLIGTDDVVPELIDLARNVNSEVDHILTSIGKLGGQEAKDFLSEVLSDSKLLASLTSGKSSKEDLKLIAIKALGRIGDPESIKAIKDFKDSLSGTRRLFVGSALKRAAEDIISRPPE